MRVCVYVISPKELNDVLSHDLLSPSGAAREPLFPVLSRA